MQRALPMLRALGTRRSVPFVVSVLFAASAVAGERAAPRAWEHESSDVPPRAEIRFGAFPSGMRFAWLDNAEPDLRCSLRLHVDVGSLAEEEHERGMAHFLEHLAFNGSEHFPPGTLIEWLQERGLDFGADSNAQTGFDETIYMLDLPSSDDAMLREGLTVLRDVAAGLTLASAEVDAEKGVIDGEERERDSARYRLFTRALDVQFAGSRLAVRVPIGTKQARDAFTSESVRAFYGRWYRPENMTLVLVGDLEGRDPEPLLREAFESLAAPAGAPDDRPGPGPLDLEPRWFALHDPEIPQAILSVQQLEPWQPEPFTRAELVEDLPLQLAHAMIELRLRRLTEAADCPFLAASLDQVDEFDLVQGEGFSVVCTPERWREALAAVEQEVRRAVLHGFLPGELEQVAKDVALDLDEAVAREATQSSRGLAAELVLAANRRYVPAAAATIREIVAPALAAATPAACHDALAEAWADGVPSVSATGGLDLGDDAEQELRAALDASRAVAVAPPERRDDAEFAYAVDPARTGAVLLRERIADLGVERVEFQNGVRLFLKRTDFKAREVNVSARIGEGGLTLWPPDPALAFVANGAFDDMGLGAHDEEDLRRLTAGRSVGVGFGIEEGSFALGGRTTPEDLSFQLELMRAYLVDPGFRAEGIDRLRRRVPQLFEQMKHEPHGPLLTSFLPALYGDDPRFLFPEQAAIEAVSPDAMRAWLVPQLADAPITLAATGDLDADATIAAVAATFGTLPPRRALEPFADRRVVPAMKAGLEARHEIDTNTPNALVFVAFGTTDGMDTVLARRLSFLARVLNDRLRLEVRERLGLSYAPSASSDASDEFPGQGRITIQANAAPAEVDTMVRACLAVAGTLATEGVTDEEMHRLREPLLAAVRDQLRRNGYWTSVLLDMHDGDGSFDDARTLIDDYTSMGADEVGALARKYLAPERASVLVVTPRPPA